jgi:hypothetical protein
MSGGTISGNTVSQAGGGVYFEGDVKAAMSGGEISGNSASQVGAGLMLSGLNANLTMTGGTISGNSAQYNGGGVCLGGGNNDRNDIHGGKFTMKGGAIFGNTSRRFGGGISTQGPNWDNGTFIMEGGRVQGSTASDGFAANTATLGAASLQAAGMPSGTMKWGIGGTYTKGGVPQTGGSDIAQGRRDESPMTSDTLIAIPAR